MEWWRYELRAVVVGSGRGDEIRGRFIDRNSIHRNPPFFLSTSHKNPFSFPFSTPHLFPFPSLVSCILTQCVTSSLYGSKQIFFFFENGIVGFE